ncbi:MAG: phosphoribosyltransferase [Leptospiraceae bacterium]|nr:phosphoribosyltransferase [Leptospiraceae bacterium]
MDRGILIKELEFGSILSYCPKPTKEVTKNAKNVMNALKNEQTLVIKRENGSKQQLPASICIGIFLKENLKLYEDIFDKRTNLIPLPRSSLITKDALWPSLKIAQALEKEGLGAVFPIIKREKPIRPSSKSKVEERPSPEEHYSSLKIDRRKLKSNKIVLFDDVITRGHTFMGSAWKILESYPEAKIFCFSAMRTISNEEEFKSLVDPVRGKIIYREKTKDCIRRP